MIGHPRIAFAVNLWRLLVAWCEDLLQRLRG